MKIIYNTITNQLQKYPRNDEEPVVGLSPELLVFDVIQESEPIVGEGFSYYKSEPVIDIENMTVTYGWIIEEPVLEVPEPNYVQFLNDITMSAIYQKVIQQSITNPVVMVGFTTTMGALILATGGNANSGGITSAFGLMLSGMTLVEGDINELLSIIDNNNLNAIIDISAFVVGV